MGFAPAYPLRTARLDLRPHTMADLEDLLEFHTDPDVVRYLPWPVRDRRMTLATLQAKLGQGQIEHEGQWLVLAAVLRDPDHPRGGKVIGEVLLKWHSEAHRQGELGFAFARAVHGQGLAREAAEAMLTWGFADFGLHRIVGCCDTRNLDSARLLGRLGMTQQAHFHHDMLFKGEWSDTFVYAMTADDWASRAVDQSVPRSESE
jgi:RimJ/RimL family protein N-acetyltransferase